MSLQGNPAPHAIALFFSLILYGVIFTQGLIYYQTVAHKAELAYVRLFIPFILLLNTFAVTLQFASILHDGYDDIVGGLWIGVFILSVCTFASCQFFVTYRSVSFARKIRGRPLPTVRIVLSVLVLLLICASVVAAATSIWYLHARPDDLDVTYKKRKRAAVAYIGACVIGDLYLTISISYDFHRVLKSNADALSVTDRVVKSLIFLTMRNGSGLLILQIVFLALFYFQHELWIKAMVCIVPRLASVTIFLYLNSPRAEHRRLAKEDEERRQNLDIVMDPHATPNSSSTHSFPSPQTPVAGVCTCGGAQGSLSDRSRSNRKRFSMSRRYGYATSSTGAVGPTEKVVVLVDDEEDERLNGILVEMAGYVTVEIDQGREADEEGKGVSETWEERRDRLALGNSCTVETLAKSSFQPQLPPSHTFPSLSSSHYASPSDPNPSSTQSLTAPSGPSTLAAPISPSPQSRLLPSFSPPSPLAASSPLPACTTIELPSLSLPLPPHPSPLPPPASSLPSPRPPSSSSPLFARFRPSSEHRTTAATHPRPNTTYQSSSSPSSSRSHPPLAFIDSFPTVPTHSTSQGTFDPDSDEFDFKEMMFGPTTTSSSEPPAAAEKMSRAAAGSSRGGGRSGSREGR